ncbi:MAG: hypothetical protein MHM6MM_001076 [Cercozoa sp. M6MM]
MESSYRKHNSLLVDDEVLDELEAFGVAFEDDSEPPSRQSVPKLRIYILTLLLGWTGLQWLAYKRYQADTRLSGRWCTVHACFYVLLLVSLFTVLLVLDGWRLHGVFDTLNKGVDCFARAALCSGVLLHWACDLVALPFLMRQTEQLQDIHRHLAAYLVISIFMTGVGPTAKVITISALIWTKVVHLGLQSLALGRLEKLTPELERAAANVLFGLLTVPKNLPRCDRHVEPARHSHTTPQFQHSQTHNVRGTACDGRGRA